MTDLQILDAETTVALEELAAASGLAPQEVLELVEYGAFEVSGEGPGYRFRAQTIVQARRVARLRDDFELAPPAMSLVLALLERIEALERRILEAECGSPR
jgi:chaperone modulatory protein CbpM